MAKINKNDLMRRVVSQLSNGKLSNCKLSINH